MTKPEYDWATEHITRKTDLAERDSVVCLDSRGYSRRLTEGNIYQCLFGVEVGIFTSSPYITVIGDDGKQVSCHASRFAKAK